jgi:hypothetical protein
MSFACANRACEGRFQLEEMVFRFVDHRARTVDDNRD